MMHNTIFLFYLTSVNQVHVSQEILRSLNAQQAWIDNERSVQFLQNILVLKADFSEVKHYLKDMFYSLKVTPFTKGLSSKRMQSFDHDCRYLTFPLLSSYLNLSNRYLYALLTTLFELFCSICKKPRPLFIKNEFIVLKILLFNTLILKSFKTHFV